MDVKANQAGLRETATGWIRKDRYCLRTVRSVLAASRYFAEEQVLPTMEGSRFWAYSNEEPRIGHQSVKQRSILDASGPILRTVATPLRLK